METNSDIYLIGFSIGIFLLVTFFFLKKIASSNELKVKIEEVPDSVIKDDEPAQSSFDFNEEAKKNSNFDQKLIIFNLISIDGSFFDIDQLFGFISNYETKLINGYFSYKHNNEEIFRIANAINPGTFRPETKSQAIIIASDINNVDDAVHTVEEMLNFAAKFSDNFHASICDVDRLPLTKQMISHVRSTAQEASRLKQVSDYA